MQPQYIGVDLIKVDSDTKKTDTQIFPVVVKQLTGHLGSLLLTLNSIFIFKKKLVPFFFASVAIVPNAMHDLTK